MYIFTKQIIRYSLKKFFGLTVTSFFGIIFAFPTYPSNILTKGCSCHSGSLTWPNNPLLYHLTVHKVIMFFENTQLGRLKDNIIISYDFQSEQVFIYVLPSHPFFRLWKYVGDAYCQKSFFLQNILLVHVKSVSSNAVSFFTKLWIQNCPSNNLFYRNRPRRGLIYF